MPLYLNVIEAHPSVTPSSINFKYRSQRSPITCLVSNVLCNGGGVPTFPQEKQRTGIIIFNVFRGNNLKECVSLSVVEENVGRWLEISRIGIDKAQKKKKDRDCSLIGAKKLFLTFANFTDQFDKHNSAPWQDLRQHYGFRIEAQERSSGGGRYS